MGVTSTLRAGAAALLFLACASPANALTPHTPVFVDPTQLVNVDSGEEFFLALPSNVTTGYSWTQSIADGNILAYEGNVYEGPFQEMPGAGGQQIFIYHANRSGSTVVTFVYARPFEPND
ncbi:MAG TPA: protease inhibitor I42 family protein, partial [Candidatus Tumulicola sp.]